MYSIDTSAILDGMVRYYPRTVFSGLWIRLQDLIKEGNLFASEEVKAELEKQNDDALEWATEQSNLFVEVDDEIQDEVSKILANHPRLIDTRKGRSGADPLVIALAKVRECSVVTGELPSNSLKRPKIPDVCNSIGVECLNLLGLMRREGWVFPACRSTSQDTP